MVPVIGVRTPPFVTLKSLTRKVKGPAEEVNRCGVLSKSMSTPPAVPLFTEPVIADMKVPAPAVPAGSVKVTNSVNGVLNVLCVAVPCVSEKKPSVSFKSPVPIGAMPPESVTLKLPLLKVSVPPVPLPTGVPVILVGDEPVVHGDPKQPLVLPTNDVAFAADAPASAAPARSERTKVRIIDLPYVAPESARRLTFV